MLGPDFPAVKSVTVFQCEAELSIATIAMPGAGVHARKSDSRVRFVPVALPGAPELQRPARRIGPRVGRHLERHGLLIRQASSLHPSWDYDPARDDADLMLRIGNVGAVPFQFEGLQNGADNQGNALIGNGMTDYATAKNGIQISCNRFQDSSAIRGFDVAAHMTTSSSGTAFQEGRGYNYRLQGRSNWPAASQRA